MIRAGWRAWAVAAIGSVYLTVLAAAAPHQIHHAGERLVRLLQPRRPAPPDLHSHSAGKPHGHDGPGHPHRDPARPAAEPACALEGALAWKGAELPAPPPDGIPAEVAGANLPSALFSHASFRPISLSIRAPPPAVAA
jgi:hypothetical protein